MKLTYGFLLLVMLVIGFVLLSSSFVNALQISNALSCDMFQKNNVPSGYYPLIGVMATLTDVNGNPINAHLSDINSNEYGYVLACSTNGYAELEGKVLDKGEHCDKMHYAYVINMSNKTNAHVKSPYSTSNDAYYNEFCINIPSMMQGLTGYMYCDVKDECASDETCLFKFTGKTSDSSTLVDSNAHVYDCDTNILPQGDYKQVCCKLLLNPEGELIVDVKSDMIAGSDLYLQLGMYSQIMVSVTNPSSKPQSITLTLDSTDDESGRIFRNFVWFNNRGAMSREVTLKLKPYERDYVQVNVFGGKVGKYKLFINKIQDNNEIRVFALNVTVLPSSVKGINAESPEFGNIYAFLIFLTAAALLYMRLR